MEDKECLSRAYKNPVGGQGEAKDTEKVIRREKSLKMSERDSDLSTDRGNSHGQCVTYVFGCKRMITVSDRKWKCLL